MPDARPASLVVAIPGTEIAVDVTMNKIVPYLWFDSQAEEAARLYVSLFERSAIGDITHYGEAGAKAAGKPAGSVMTVEFRLEGQDFVALNGGPTFTFSPAISLFVNCQTQQEVDRLYEGLAAGGEIQPCGWIRDRYGVSWQIVPGRLGRMLKDKDPGRVERVMQALLQMKKIDLAALGRAYGE
jgi:predicted 3-demethylubiquinone-9 3-methyltransferase (glyoxalase superfamily)